MKYFKIDKCDTANSKGFSTSIFLSGCGLKEKCCKCFSPHLWDFNVGEEYTQKTEDYIIMCLSKPYIKWFSILGGNPTDNLESGELLKLVKRIRNELPHIFIACWSGQLFEDLVKVNYKLEFLKEIDMLRDGRFIPDLSNMQQFLGGSTNQRYVDCKKSISENKLIEYKF